MKVIDVYSPKGGVSKTTIASSVAAGLAARGYKVALIDKDEQKSSASFFIDNDFGFDVFVGKPNNNKYDFCVNDFHPSHTAQPDGDVIVLPLRPSRPDFESFRRVKAAIKNIPIVMVVTQVDKRINDDAMFLKHMEKQYDALSVMKRNVYSRSFSEKKTVFQMGKAYRAKEARDEINKIINEVLNVT